MSRMVPGVSEMRPFSQPWSLAGSTSSYVRTKLGTWASYQPMGLSSLPGSHESSEAAVHKGRMEWQVHFHRWPALHAPTLLRHGLRTNSLKEDCVPVKVQELLLAAGEPAHIHNPNRINAHSLERGTMSNRRDYKLSAILEADEPTIEEMINARRQKEAILAVQPLFVGRVSPWLAVTGYQVHGIFDARDAAS